jgi:uncharacterized protein YcbX
VHIKSIWEYPIKGLGGNSICRTTLSIHQTLPGDRRYALSAGDLKAAQADDGVWLQKAHFLQLMQTESLAALMCQLNGDIVTIHETEANRFVGNLDNTDDRTKCQNFIADFLQMPDPAMLRIHQIKNGAFTDQPEPLLSIGGSASLAAFAAATGTKTDPRRFRLNLIITTDTAFSENEWGGAKLKIGEAIIEIVDDVKRCKAINVDPASATRQPDHLITMRQTFGHSYLGVFGRVIVSGAIQCGDGVSVISDK